MPRFLPLLALLAIFWPASAAETVADDLAWLSGQWLGTMNGNRIEEHYMRPAAGIIVGMSRSLRAGRPPEVEFIRIAPDATGRLAYHAHPMGQAPAVFPLVEASPDLAVFANPAHDFPQVIRYRRVGDTLTATIEGPGKDGATRQFSWSWTLAGPAP